MMNAKWRLTSAIPKRRRLFWTVKEVPSSRELNATRSYLQSSLQSCNHKGGLSVAAITPHEPAAPDFRSVEGVLPFPLEREHVILLVQDVPDIQGTFMPAFLLSFFSSSIVRTVLVVGYCQFGQARPAVQHPAASHGRASCRVPTEGILRVANCPHLRPGLKPPPEPSTSM